MAWNYFNFIQNALEQTCLQTYTGHYKVKGTPMHVSLWPLGFAPRLDVFKLQATWRQVHSTTQNDCNTTVARSKVSHLYYKCPSIPISTLFVVWPTVFKLQATLPHTYALMTLKAIRSNAPYVCPSCHGSTTNRFRATDCCDNCPE